MRSSFAAAPSSLLNGQCCVRLCPSQTLQSEHQSTLLVPSLPHTSTTHCSITSSQFLHPPFLTKLKPTSNSALPSNTHHPIMPKSHLGGWKNTKNGIIWEATEIAEATAGKLIRQNSAGCICTDTRVLEEGEWFLALSGLTFDGHQFLHQALAKGCAGIIAKEAPLDWSAGFVQVTDTTDALLCLAGEVRRNYSRPVVGITGSCGKTTTRVMTALALESLGHIHQTQGNHNNRYGVSFSLLKMSSCSWACVLEMGMNHPGEILELSRVAQPTIRVILNIGAAHLQNFGSVEEIAAAKGELFADAQPGDVCVVNADDPLVMGLPIPEGIQVVRFGSNDNCNLRLSSAKLVKGGLSVSLVLEHWVNELERETSVAASLSMVDNHDISVDIMSLSQLGNPGNKTCFVESSHLNHDLHYASKTSWKCKSRVEFEISSPGLHLALNACAAAAVATLLGVPLRNVAESLSKYRPLSMRSRFEELGSGIFLIDDSYNANPMSMKAALELLQSIGCKGQKVALLGDMLELGDLTKEAHTEALRLCQTLGVNIIGLAGPIFMESAHTDEVVRAYLESCDIFVCCPDSASLATAIVSKMRRGDVILVKGSRSVQMEVVVAAIKQTFPRC